MRGIRHHDVATAVRISALPASPVAACLDHRDDALRAARCQITGRIIRRMEQRQSDRDDLVFHSFQAVKCPLAAKAILREELDERIATDGGDLVVRFEYV